MSTVEITRVEDVRVGDRVTLAADTTVITANVTWVSASDTQTHLELERIPFPPTVVAEGTSWQFVHATREVPDLPDLPTEPGSIIVNATIRGVPGQTAILDTDGDWFTFIQAADGFWSHDPEHITAWEPGRIVPEGGAS